MTVIELIEYLRKYSMTTKVYLSEDCAGCCIKKLKGIVKQSFTKKKNDRTYDAIVIMPDDEIVG